MLGSIAGFVLREDFGQQAQDRLHQGDPFPGILIMARTHVGEECVQGMQEQTGESEAIVAPLKCYRIFLTNPPSHPLLMIYISRYDFSTSLFLRKVFFNNEKDKYNF